MKMCAVCGIEIGNRRKYCEEHSSLVSSLCIDKEGHRDTKKVVLALKTAFRDGNFYCQYTGDALKRAEADSYDPFDITIDHIDPKNRHTSELQVLARKVNQAKGCCNPQEFRAMIKDLIGSEVLRDQAGEADPLEPGV